eukprot:3690919-Rhodomonas_salina.1
MVLPGLPEKLGPDPVAPSTVLVSLLSATLLSATRICVESKRESTMRIGIPRRYQGVGIPVPGDGVQVLDGEVRGGSGVQGGVLLWR